MRPFPVRAGLLFLTRDEYSSEVERSSPPGDLFRIYCSGEGALCVCKNNYGVMDHVI